VSPSRPAAAVPSAAPGGGLARALAVLRRVIGVPDYDAYLAHMRDHHPQCAVLTRDEFLAERMRDKYSKPGQRCC
jgi:uncharacterized short protein YbdD (DUF466 family)